MHTHGYSRRLLTRLKREPEHIRRNGAHVRMVDSLCAGDTLTVILNEDAALPPNADLQVPIVYEDEDLIVFNKPQSMPVHPSIAHHGDTLGNFFSYHMQQQGRSPAFRPINRLDADTTGLCLAAKNPLCAKLLAHAVEKEYVALVCGELPDNEGVIDAPIARESDTIIKRCVAPHGQPSITEYRVLERGNGYTLVQVHLKTGRTHQIRVHFAHLGYPLAGDWLYGGDLTHFQKHTLCCRKLIFIHPSTQIVHNICINIPIEWRNMPNQVNKHTD